VQQLFKFVKNLYSEVPNRMNSIFNYKSIVKVTDLSSLNLEHVLNETFTSFQIMTDSKQIVNKENGIEIDGLTWRKNKMTFLVLVIFVYSKSFIFDQLPLP
jgi:hypothetical protein